MKTILTTRVTATWIILVMITTLLLAAGEASGSSQQASMLIIFIASVKVRFVMLDFMEVRYAPIFLRLAVESWIVVICTILIVSIAI